MAVPGSASVAHMAIARGGQNEAEAEGQMVGSFARGRNTGTRGSKFGDTE
jgi:hypothetical protein